MNQTVAATPFGRRPVTLGQIAARMQARQAVETAAEAGSNAPAAVNKWALFRQLAEIKHRIGVTDRALGVLNALLTFHPETALSLPGPGGQGELDLVVFPSNRQLCLRAHGMAEATLRRHLAALMEAGLIIRRDSPNGKRYARKDVSGKERFSDVFGFDLTPLVARAAEFETLADEERQARKRLAVLKERISLHRRDAGKLIAFGLDTASSLEVADFPDRDDAENPETGGPWDALRQRFMRLVTPLRRLKGFAAFEALEAGLRALRDDAARLAEMLVPAPESKAADMNKSINMSGNDAETGRHESNSKSDSQHDFEPASDKARSGAAENPEKPAPPVIPLGLVLEACPDIRDYGPPEGIRSWSAFHETARLVRPMIGISPDAWREAAEVLGETGASIAVAAILQRSEHSSEAVDGTVRGSPVIKSPGGYLRALTQKARAGEFSAGPLLMALIGQRLKAKRGGGIKGTV